MSNKNEIQIIAEYRIVTQLYLADGRLYVRHELQRPDGITCAGFATCVQELAKHLLRTLPQERDLPTTEGIPNVP